MNDADTLQEGATLGRYEIRRLIGRGGMGCVYEAVHRDLKKRVAIKTLMPSLSANQEARVRFLREGEAASRIRHPNVVDVTDVGAEGNTSYLVMEYLDGEDLASFITRQGWLTPVQTADIILPVAAAIATAHEQGVIHRDLKPANVFLSHSPLGGIQPKVLDFGISKVMGDRGTMVLTGTGATFGTTFYLPPEQLQAARQADAKSDQYALGTILYECVTGQRAFEHDNLYTVLKNIAEGTYERPRARRPDLPAGMEELIMRAMMVDPAARYASVKELGAVLAEFASPQARVLWAPFFGSPAGYDGAASNGGDAAMGLGYGMAGGTMVLPPAPDGVRRPKPTPQPLRRLSHSAASSTLGNATGESMSPFAAPVPNLKKSRAPLFIGIGVIAVAGAIVGVMQLGGGGLGSVIPTSSRSDDSASTRTGEKHPPSVLPAPTFRVEVETDPREAAIELDGRPVGTGAFDQRLPSDGTGHVIVVRAPGYRDTTVRFTDRPPPHLLTLEAITAPTTPKADTTAQNPPRGGSTRPSPPVEPLADRSNRISSGGHRASPPPIARDPRRIKRRRGAPSAGPDDGPVASPPPRDSAQTANGAPIID
ncbi:MAG TPA: protein kinase [Polyangia bacterium]